MGKIVRFMEIGVADVVSPSNDMEKERYLMWAMFGSLVFTTQLKLCFLILCSLVKILLLPLYHDLLDHLFIYFMFNLF